MYRNKGVITRFLNKKRIPQKDRQQFINLLTLNPQLIKIIKMDTVMSEKHKIEFLINIIRYDMPPCVATLGNQGSGKDVTTTFIIDKLIRTSEVLEYLKKGYSIEYLRDNNLLPFRVCTYFNFADYPFVKTEDKYFNLESVPRGTKNRPVLLYVSELDMAFPARMAMKGDENDILNTQLNTLRQNNIIIIGTAKVAANVDVAFWRHCALLLFKFIDKQKLLYGERKSFISEETHFMLPRNRYDKEETLLVYGEQMLTFHNTKPEWYTDDISCQYANITNEQKNDYRKMLIEKGLKPEKADIEMRRLFSLQSSEM